MVDFLDSNSVHYNGPEGLAYLSIVRFNTNALTNTNRLPPLEFLLPVDVSAHVWVTNSKFHHDMNGKKGMLCHGRGQFVMSCCFYRRAHRKKSVRIRELSKKTLITLRWFLATALNLCV